jgi:uncharacterized 2Fe-2S/4Fe-4S cluster protein (DUF4445 family)
MYDRKLVKQYHEVIFLPEGRHVTVQEDTTLLQAARAGGLTVEAPCDGRGSCGKCRVRVSGELTPPDEFEVSQLGDLLAEGLRLACRARIGGSVRAEVLHTGSETFVAVTEGKSCQWSFDPPIRKVAIENPEAGCERRALVSGGEPVFPEKFPAMLRELAEKERQGLLPAEIIMKNDKIVAWQYQAGQPCYGIALDLGTTSVVAELVDLISSESLGTSACLNPQAEYGGDVLTRISFAAQHTNGMQILQKKIVEGINNLIDRLTGEQNLCSEDIFEVVVAGNTTMLHLLMGVSPHSLAQSPYRPVFTQQMEVSATELGVHMAARGMVTVLPSAAAFVGADIVAGLLAIGHYSYSKITLFIDIGTNGELVVSRNGKLVGTSSAAGPALEGMNISCGCRAESGAIEGVIIDSNCHINLEVIGDGKPKGICGSGLVDLVAELVRCGVIEANGRFAKKDKLVPMLASRLVDVDERPAFLVSEVGHIYISQKDVRQVQLAKGAIAAAIELLLKELDISCTDVEEVLVAGAFGAHLKPSSLIGIGLLPPVCQGKIRFVGNTAKAGAMAVLLNRQAAMDVVEIAQAIKVIDLSCQPEFQDCFIKSLSYPDRTKTIMI